MKIMWHISRWGDLSPVKVVRETEKTVWTVNGRRQAKKADYYTMIFDKKSEAIEFYINSINRKIDHMCDQLNYCRADLEKYRMKLDAALAEEQKTLDKVKK